MGIEKVEFLEDIVKVHFYLKKPWGEPDEWGIKEFPYKSIETLPIFSELPTPIDSRDNYWSEEIFITNINRTLIFVFNSYPAKSMGPEEESIIGIYRKDSCPGST